jgi:PAS domain S-box-containing protein
MESSQSTNLRTFGTDLVGVVPWGTHLCQFYESKQDLIDILVPYFAQGLQNNEFCMWVTSPPLEVQEAKKALHKAVPDLNEYIRKEQIEIISYNDWYLKEGKFNCNRVLKGWVQKEKNAIERGFAGLRLTGNTFWIERDLWNSFVDYEEAVNSVIGQYKMMAVCTYCLTNCTGTDVLDVVRNHVGTLIKQGKKWYLVEDAARRKATNGALKLSEKKYSTLFANMQDAFAYHKVLFDDSGKPVDYVFLEINDAFEQFTGLKRENVLSKPVTQVLPGIEKDPANWIGVYGKVATTGEPVKFENYAEALQKWYLVSAYSPEKDYFVATFEDVTERKKAEKALRDSEEQFRRAIEDAPIPVIMLAEDEEVLQISNAWTELTGYKMGNMKRFYKWLTNAIYGEDATVVRDHMNELFKGKKRSIGIEFCILTRDGEIRNWSFSASSPGVLGDGRRFIVGMAEDITESKQMQSKIEEYSKSLERLVEERTKQLNDAERMAAIGQTAGMVGHDIRNPLQAITSDIYLAKSDLASMPESEEKESMRESLVEIEKNVEYINKVVQDLQDFARPIHPVVLETDLEAFLCHEVLFSNELPENIDASCRVDEDTKLVADPALLKRVLNNLINNAIQAMPQGGKLTVRAFKESNETVITVEDTGVGIPENVRSKLFTPLFTTKSRGQGFGLAVVKRMTEALDGTVTFESEEDKGTKFIIRLPQKQ